MKTILFFLFVFLFLTSQSQLSTHIEQEKSHYHSFISKSEKNNLLNNYDVSFYFIDIEATNLNKAISGKTSIKAKVVNQPLSELLLQLHSSLTVDSVTIDGVQVTYTFSNHEIHAFPAQPIPVNQYFTATVYYKGTSAGTGIKNGQSPSWQKKVTWTLSESYHAMDWFPCKQVLTDKADSAYVFITCTNNLKAGSNGLLTKITTLPGNKVRYEWKTYYPIAYYLLSFTISEYQEYIQYAKPIGYNDSIYIQNYIYDNPGYLPYFQNQINNTKNFIELLSELYGLYPFHSEKYGHCTAPIGGGMEHQTMTTLSYFDFELVIHELGHQWFGDYVTCATWQDIWINEGFATYTYYLGAQHLLSQTEADQWMNNVHNDVMAQPNGSVYVPFSDIYNENRIFDYRLTYEKGAAIIHTIRYIINNDIMFFNMLKAFLQQYAFSTATAEDFKNFATTYTGINFQQFFDEWFYGEGYPTYSLVYQQSNDTLTFIFSQQASAPNITPFFHNPVDIQFSSNGTDMNIRMEPTQNNVIAKVFFPENIISVSIDPKNYIVNKVGTITKVDNLQEYQNIILYPNPVQDVLFIQTNKPITQITLSDIYGKIIPIKYNPELFSIDLQHLSKGVYFLKVNLHTYKFVKT
ncbi:MAG: M1 family aminopeptidase [Bacteroidales bacterium]|nr:M1 family aminopeptidase [Bacteroidales bacterium]